MSDNVKIILLIVEKYCTKENYNLTIKMYKI
jgi:hypothetical protein